MYINLPQLVTSIKTILLRKVFQKRYVHIFSKQKSEHWIEPRVKLLLTQIQGLYRENFGYLNFYII